MDNTTFIDSLNTTFNHYNNKSMMINNEKEFAYKTNDESSDKMEILMAAPAAGAEEEEEMTITSIDSLCKIKKKKNKKRKNDLYDATNKEVLIDKKSRPKKLRNTQEQYPEQQYPEQQYPEQQYPEQQYPPQLPDGTTTTTTSLQEQKEEIVHKKDLQANDVVLGVARAHRGIYEEIIEKWWEQYEIATSGLKRRICDYVINEMLQKGIRFLSKVNNANHYYMIESSHSMKIVRKMLRTLRQQVLDKTKDLTLEQQSKRDISVAKARRKFIMYTKNTDNTFLQEQFHRAIQFINNETASTTNQEQESAAILPEDESNRIMKTPATSFSKKDSHTGSNSVSLTKLPFLSPSPPPPMMNNLHRMHSLATFNSTSMTSMTLMENQEEEEEGEYNDDEDDYDRAFMPIPSAMNWNMSDLVLFGDLKEDGNKKKHEHNNKKKKPSVSPDTVLPSVTTAVADQKSPIVNNVTATKSIVNQQDLNPSKFSQDGTTKTKSLLQPSTSNKFSNIFDEDNFPDEDVEGCTIPPLFTQQSTISLIGGWDNASFAAMTDTSNNWSQNLTATTTTEDNTASFLKPSIHNRRFNMDEGEHYYEREANKASTTDSNDSNCKATMNNQFLYEPPQAAAVLQTSPMHRQKPRPTNGIVSPPFISEQQQQSGTMNEKKKQPPSSSPPRRVSTNHVTSSASQEQQEEEQVIAGNIVDLLPLPIRCSMKQSLNENGVYTTTASTSTTMNTTADQNNDDNINNNCNNDDSIIMEQEYTKRSNELRQKLTNLNVQLQYGERKAIQLKQESDDLWNHLMTIQYDE